MHFICPPEERCLKNDLLPAAKVVFSNDEREREREIIFEEVQKSIKEVMLNLWKIDQDV